MKSPVFRDQKSRQNFNVNEENFRIFKTLKTNLVLGISPWARYKLDKLPKASYRNRCLLSFRGKAVYSGYKISRHLLKSMAFSKKLPGVFPK